VVVWKRTQQQFRRALMSAQLLLVKGIVETKQGVTHIIAGALYDYTGELDTLRLNSRDFR
jgi:error-prone DNA polymerase